LEELAEDLGRHQTVVRLFLELPPSADGLPAQKTSVPVVEPFPLPLDSFPQTCTVTDACITKASFVWFHKHFYL
jgi:hypothetical protein